MDDDVRFDRDIYTWLTSMGLSEHYFMFKSAGYERIRDILYATEDDMGKIGIPEGRVMQTIMLGIRHVAVPDAVAVDPSYHTIFQCGRLLVDIFGFVQYEQMVRSMGVCRGWRHALSTGVRVLKIERPLAIGAPVDTIIMRFEKAVGLTGTRFGEKGMAMLKRGLVGMIEKSDLGSQLRQIDLSSNDISVDGTAHLCEAMQLGALTHLESLNLAYNGIKPLGARYIHKTLCFKRHRTIRVLDLSGNPIGDRGVAALADAMVAESIPVLVELRLGCALIGNSGAKALGKALAEKAAPKLKALDLRFNQMIKDGGGAHIMLACQVNGMPELEHLCIKGHGMTRSMCMKFLRASDGLYDLSL